MVNNLALDNKFMNKRQNFTGSKEIPEYEKRVLDIARVTRTVAGGRRFSFRATLAIGNRQGLIGVGVAKGKDIAQAVDKAYKKAQKNLIEVIRENGTIPIDVIGKFKSTRVLLRPARQGKGLIAGGVVRALCDLAGVENISAKILTKSNNKLNIARATLNAFEKINHYRFKIEKKGNVKTEREEKKEEIKNIQESKKK